MMIRSRLFTLLFACVLFSCLSQAHAVTIKITSVNPAAYAEIPVGAGLTASSRGTVTSATTGDKLVFLHILAELEAANWGDSTKWHSIKSEDIALTANGKNIGELLDTPFVGLINARSATIDWPAPLDRQKNPNITTKAHFSAIYAIPADATTLTLTLTPRKLGQTALPPASINFKMPAIAKRFDPAAQLTLKVRRVELLDEIETNPNSQNRVRTVIRNPGGKIARLELEATPTELADRGAATAGLRTTFAWSSSHLAMQLAPGRNVPCLGARIREMSAGLTYANLTHTRDNVGWRTATTEVFFPVPPDLKDFDLLFTGTPVAKGTTK